MLCYVITLRGVVLTWVQFVAEGGWFELNLSVFVFNSHFVVQHAFGDWGCGVGLPIHCLFTLEKLKTGLVRSISKLLN